jgi:hypothetical protein
LCIYHILLIPDLTQVIGYFLEQVLAVYGLLSNLQEGFVMNNILFVSSAMIFTWLIFVTCNIAQRATEEVGTLCLFVCLIVDLLNVFFSNAMGYEAWNRG